MSYDETYGNKTLLGRGDEITKHNYPNWRVVINVVTQERGRIWVI